MDLSEPVDEFVLARSLLQDGVTGQRPDLVDSRHSWLVAVACAWTHIWMSVIFRSAGVLLVAMVTTFRIPREEASWPLVLNMTISCFTAFFAGFLLKRFDSRAIAAIGCAIASFSAIGCFIWNGPTSYTVLLGFCFGLGSGVCVPTSVVVLSRYFKQNLALANGINFAGASISSILFPPIVALLLDRYGLQGTMLLIGGLTMNGVAGSIVLRSSSTFPIYSASMTPRAPRTPNTASSPKTGAVTLGWHSVTGVASAVTDSLSFLEKAYFYPITLAGMVYNFALTTYLLIIVDHGMSHGLSHTEASLLLSWMSLADLVSRLCTGPLTDRHVFTRLQVITANFGLMSSCCLLLPLMESAWELSALSVALGICSGGTVIVIPVLLLEHMGIEHFPVSFGLHRMAVGLSTMLRPVLIGYFKDNEGSYDGLFYVTGMGCALVTVMWGGVMLNACIKSRRRRRAGARATRHASRDTG